MRFDAHIGRHPPRFGFGWEWYWNGDLLVVSFYFYKRSLDIEIERVVSPPPESVR